MKIVSCSKRSFVTSRGNKCHLDKIFPPFSHLQCSYKLLLWFLYFKNKLQFTNQEEYKNKKVKKKGGVGGGGARNGPCRRRPVRVRLLHASTSAAILPPRVLSLTSATAAALRQLPSIPGLRQALLRREHSGMPAPSLPSLSCETEHPKPNLSYSDYL